MTNGSRFHCEVTGLKAGDDFSVRFNIFGDDLPAVVDDLEAIIAYSTGVAAIPRVKPAGSIAPQVPQIPAAAARSAAIAASDALAAAAKPFITTRPAPATRPPSAAQVGVCVKCGSDDLEWVSGTRKDNGKAFAAYRCQSCKAWQPEVK